MSNKKPLIVCASIAYMEDRVRLNKLREVFRTNTTEFIFWGWRREDKLHKKDYFVKHLWRGGGYSSKKLLLHYPIWIIMVFISSLKLKKDELVYAVSLDVALPIYLGSIFKGYTYIFDNPDNFSLTYNLKGFVKIIVDKIESVVAKKAKHHILPDNSRFQKKHNNIIILPNFPLKSEIEKAKKIYQNGTLEEISLTDIKNDKRFKIYINGRMVKHRGSEWISDTFEKLDKNKFLIIVAGNIYCKKLENTIKKLENIIRFPRLENYQALSLYYCADLVFAFYDPILPINRKAAANKWWDCVVCEVPFVSNSEVETLSIFRKENACFSIPYNSDKLLILLKELEENRDYLSQVKSNLEKLSTYSWDKKIKEILLTKEAK